MLFYSLQYFSQKKLYNKGFPYKYFEPCRRRRLSLFFIQVFELHFLLFFALIWEKSTWIFIRVMKGHPLKKKAYTKMLSIIFVSNSSWRNNNSLNIKTYQLMVCCRTGQFCRQKPGNLSNNEFLHVSLDNFCKTSRSFALKKIYKISFFSAT